MELNIYQTIAQTFCTQESDNPAYAFFGMVEELGEVSGKIAKQIRKGNLKIDGNCVFTKMTDTERTEFESDLKGELGDCLWMLSQMCLQLGFSLEDVAVANLEKLESRKKRGVIVGEGDHR